jgi:glucan 1,3-beta-glucosidase
LYCSLAVTEPFITPALYEKYVNTSGSAIVDEWTLSIAMGENLAKELEAHYATFIVSHHFYSNCSYLSVVQTEKDFAEIAGPSTLHSTINEALTVISLAAGLNWVRIPIGFWAIETIGNEPFLVGTSWKYFLKA